MAGIIQTKRCSKCKQIKPASQFYKYRSHKDGLRSECKSCYKNYQQTEEYKTYLKRYQQSEKYKAYQKRYQQCYRQTPQSKTYQKSYKQTKKHKAYQKRYYETITKPSGYTKVINAVNNAVQAGKLIRPDTLSCHYCGKPAKQYHHHLGYEPENWLDVIPVCISCHKKITHPETNQRQ